MQRRLSTIGVAAAWASWKSRSDEWGECLERRLQDAYHLLEPERPLGVGGHGVVFPGVNRSSGEIMAIKQVSKKFGKPMELRRRVTEEAEVLRVAGEHRSICTFKDLFEGDDAWYIVTELARGGELFDRLVERGAYTASGAASVMRELVDAVAYLHQMGIAHLDLKPENVLLASDETDASDVRLVDFGSARFLSGAPAVPTVGTREETGPAGATPAYAAPEVLRGEVADEKADIWSLGVILYLLLTGTHPFDPANDADDREVTKRVLEGAGEAGAFEGPNWGRVPRAARPLVRRLLAQAPDDRPSAAEVSAHPWLLAPESPAAMAIAEKSSPDEKQTQAAVDKLREFHRGRRRFKAMLLAVMLGYADDALVKEKGAGTACLGSRRAAMAVFDDDGDGIVTGDDVVRVARYMGEDLSPAEVGEMLRALDPHCRSVNNCGISTSRLRHLIPPLYPAHVIERGDVVFTAGDIDPKFYVLLNGDVLVSHSVKLRPRHGYKRSSRGAPVLSLGLHRLHSGQSFGETELLESSVPGALPRASTATCASEACELLSIPGHLFQLLSDVFDGVQEPLRAQAEDRAKHLVWSWVSALVAQASGSSDDKDALVTRAPYSAGNVAWSNRAYAPDTPLGKSLDLLHKHGGGRANRRSGILADNDSKDTFVKPSRDDAFLVVEDGVVEVVVADAHTGAKRAHVLWPQDFVYCNERPGNHPLDAKMEFASTVVVEVKAITHAQLAFVHGDVFQQALNQPAM